MRPRLFRKIWIAFGGDPSDDREIYKRYSATSPFKPISPSEEIVSCIEANYVRMKPLKELIRNKVVEVKDWGGDFENSQMMFKILPDGPTVCMAIPSPDENLLVVNCETIHENFVKSCPALFTDVPRGT